MINKDFCTEGCDGREVFINRNDRGLSLFTVLLENSSLHGLFEIGCRIISKNAGKIECLHYNNMFESIKCEIEGILFVKLEKNVFLCGSE